MVISLQVILLQLILTLLIIFNLVETQKTVGFRVLCNQGGKTTDINKNCLVRFQRIELKDVFST